MRLRRREIAPGIVEYPLPADLVGLAGSVEPDVEWNKATSVVLDEDLMSPYSEHLHYLAADFAAYLGTELRRREDLLLVHGYPGYVVQPHHDSKWFMYRTASTVSYLNPGEYTGGALYFPKLGEVSYTPDIPATVFFPAGVPYSHKTSSVRAGVRKTVRTFWSDLPPEEPHPRVRDLDISQEGAQNARNARPRPI
jgi:hypothetical protein